jgi:hypothetical protein
MKIALIATKPNVLKTATVVRLFVFNGPTEFPLVLANEDMVFVVEFLTAVSLIM